MIAPALRKIEIDLRAMIADPDQRTPERLHILATRVAAQAEMLEGGIAE